MLKLARDSADLAEAQNVSEGLLNWINCAEFHALGRILPVARTYAGILGLVAFATSLAWGVIKGKQAESVLWMAWLAMLGFAALGWVLGWVAERTVKEAVTHQAIAELASRDRPEPVREPPQAPGRS